MSGKYHSNELNNIVGSTTKDFAKFFECISCDALVVPEIVDSLRAKTVVLDKAVCGYIPALHGLP